MPFVHLQITRDGVTREQKAQVIAEFTETLQRVLAKDPQSTHIVIAEVETDNWGRGGETQTVRRRRGQVLPSSAQAAAVAGTVAGTVAGKAPRLADNTPTSA